MLLHILYSSKQIKPAAASATETISQDFCLLFTRSFNPLLVCQVFCGTNVILVALAYLYDCDSSLHPLYLGFS